mmetsp:Transcript_874/g.1261  ORF Transcript_874/g.1261 Transcript_874/m.1261 type:complete len:427 (-) Transcript_874:221-1501(-)
MLLQDRVDYFLHELINLLGRPADEEGGVHQVVQVGVHGSERGVRPDAVHQVVGRPLALHPGPRGHRVLADHLVQLLAIAAGLDAGHEDVLRGHEGELGHHVRPDDVGPDVQPVGDVGEQVEDDVHAQEALGQVDAPDRAVVQRPLEPLAGVRLGGGGGQRHHVAGQRAHALGAHGVALVGHRAGPDLLLREGLLHLLEVGEQPHVAGHLVRALGHAAQHAEDVVVDLARVGLAGDGDGPLEAHQLAHAPVQGLHLLVVALEQLQEGGLRARGALHPAHGQPCQLRLQPLEVEGQVLHPERAPLAHGRQLRRLVVREPQRGQPLVLLRKAFHHREQLHELAAHQQHGVAQLDDVRVVPHVAAGRAQVDHRHRLGANFTKGMDVPHHIMAEFGLFLFCELKVDVVKIVLHLFNLLITDVNPELLFSRC